MKQLFLFILALSTSTAAFCQTSTAKDAKLKAQIIALEKAGWEAWKNKNISWFQNNTTPECLWVSTDGINNKSQMIKSVATDCTIKSFALDSFHFVKLNDQAVLLTYIANQDGYCGNKKLTHKVSASVNYVYRAGKWLEAFYKETALTE